MLGEQLGRRCRGGEVFLLISDLGGGKTTLTKGLAAGLGSDDSVGSPSFTINRVYKCSNNLSLHHFDFYRLQDGGIVTHELSEVLDDPRAVVAIEWGDAVSDALPPNRIEIDLKRVAEDESRRQIIIKYPAEVAHIFKDLKC